MKLPPIAFGAGACAEDETHDAYGTKSAECRVTTVSQW